MADKQNTVVSMATEVRIQRVIQMEYKPCEINSVAAQPQERNAGRVTQR